MPKYGEDVTVQLTGVEIKSSIGNVSPSTDVNLTGVEAKLGTTNFNHTEVTNSEKEKSWFTALNIFIAVLLAILGFYFSPMLGGFIGVASCLIFIVGSKHAKEKRRDVTIFHH